jgi:hypothetical protein
MAMAARIGGASGGPAGMSGSSAWEALMEGYKEKRIQKGDK